MEETAKRVICENKDTELVFIIDKSGSMAGFESDTVGGFNATVEGQRTGEGRVYVSSVLFDTESRVLHDRVDIEDVKPMTKEDFRVGGCTALYDAVGDAIKHIASIHKYARPEDVPEHTIVIITTDGMENASNRYSAARVKEMIECRRENYNWEFIFLAANIDAVGTAENIGIKRERAVNYNRDCAGIQVTYEAMSEAITAMRCSHTLDAGEWRKNLDKDNKRRRK